MKKNVIKEKSYFFALDIIDLSHRLNRSKHFVISKQILKSGTSIGANVEEAIGGQTQKDFRAKLFIAYKEARESHYWLRLLRDSELISPEESKPLLNKCHELKSILASILNTMNKKIGD